MGVEGAAAEKAAAERAAAALAAVKKNATAVEHELAVSRNESEKRISATVRRAGRLRGDEDEPPGFRAAVIGGVLAMCFIPYGFYLALSIILSLYLRMLFLWCKREHSFRRTVTRTFSRESRVRQNQSGRLRKDKRKKGDDD